MEKTDIQMDSPMRKAAVRCREWRLKIRNEITHAQNLMLSLPYKSITDKTINSNYRHGCKTFLNFPVTFAYLIATFSTHRDFFDYWAL